MKRKRTRRSSRYYMAFLERGSGDEAAAGVASLALDTLQAMTSQVRLRGVRSG